MNEYVYIFRLVPYALGLFGSAVKDQKGVMDKINKYYGIEKLGKR